MQLYIVYFALPRTGLRLDSVQAAIVALSVNLGAYATEIIRAGVRRRAPRPGGGRRYRSACGRRRSSAASSCRRRLRAIYPALGSQFVLQVLGSSLVSAIAAEELTAVANNVMMQTFRNFEVFVVAGVIYLLMVLALRALFAGTGRTLFRWAV